MQKFPLIDKYLGTILDVDVAGRKPEETIVADTTRRLRRETSYNFVHALYGILYSSATVVWLSALHLALSRKSSGCCKANRYIP